MPGFSITLDTKLLDQKMNALVNKRVIAKAMVGTLNSLAFKGREKVQQTLPRVFDQPTPWTIRGVRYGQATLQRPTSSVFMSDDPNKGIPPARYLQPQAKGGRRRQKRSERAMERIGLIGRGEGWVPGDDMKLNRYGNVPGARMIQILSQLKALERVEGALQNQTARSKARNPRRKQYFSPRPGSKLPRGVYERYGRGRRQVRPVLIFIKLPTYRPRLDIPGIVRKEAARRIESTWARNLGFQMGRAGVRNR